MTRRAGDENCSAATAALVAPDGPRGKTLYVPFCLRVFRSECLRNIIREYPKVRDEGIPSCLPFGSILWKTGRDWYRKRKIGAIKRPRLLLAFFIYFMSTIDTLVSVISFWNLARNIGSRNVTILLNECKHTIFFFFVKTKIREIPYFSKSLIRFEYKIIRIL